MKKKKSHKPMPISQAHLPPGTPSTLAAQFSRSAPAHWPARVGQWLFSWWQIVYFAAVVLVMILSPASYQKTNLRQIAREIYFSTWQVLAWFAALWALLSLVLIRIVVVTALSYGLSQYALEMVVRVLVLELIPLSSALFVVLRSGMMHLMGPKDADGDNTFSSASQIPTDLMLNQIMPKVYATAFSVLTLAAVSGALALVLAYLVVYGFSPWGLAEYTRMVGRVFDPVVLLIFSLKTSMFSLAVAIIPLASKLTLATGNAANTMPKGTVRLFVVLVLIEGASLVIKYF